MSEKPEAIDLAPRINTVLLDAVRLEEESADFQMLFNDYAKVQDLPDSVLALAQIRAGKLCALAALVQGGVALLRDDFDNLNCSLELVTENEARELLERQ